MPPRSRKRGRAGAGSNAKNDGRPKVVCAATGPADGGEAAASAAQAAPTSSEDYASVTCWEKRYREGMFVEWYCGFDHVRPLFERFIAKDSSVLEVGCGDKPMAWDLRDAGYTGKICSFDFSSTVIEQHLAEKEKLDRTRLDTGVEFRVLDARNLPFEGGSFDLVVDKGTVDTMLCDEAGRDSARATCQEAARVVAPGGWFVIVSHIHPSTVEGNTLMSEVMMPGLKDSASAGEEEFSWSVDVHCGSGGDSGGSGSSEGGSDDGTTGGGGRDSDGGSDIDGGSSGGGGDDGASDGERRGDKRERKAAKEEGEGDGGGDSASLGPSAYMARKVAKRTTRSSSRGQQPLAIPIRIHEY